MSNSPSSRTATTASHGLKICAASNPPSPRCWQKFNRCGDTSFRRTPEPQRTRNWTPASMLAWEVQQRRQALAVGGIAELNAEFGLDAGIGDAPASLIEAPRHGREVGFGEFDLG